MVDNINHVATPGRHSSCHSIAPLNRKDKTMPYHYRITLENLTDNRDETPQNRALTFDVINHDDILEIIEKVRSKGILPDSEVAAFCTGLKLFSEVMMTHRKEALFQELAPAFRDFMLRLKRGETA
ncbi:DUF3861 domain-containing protein [Dickeya dadantii]|uniref:DUF3861 domain-containing protein n=2 Tax=Dickeya dadantii TaxID=204038 RepID=E0SNC2_DICD3|nr:DUF3861 domain-containing protein [Dickeya dadantii]ADN00673.1 hypothetical protein Dda3937_01027 [Dickeya dadantii 3937]